MRIAFAQIWQETHSFNPILTGVEDFRQGGLYFGDEIFAKMEDLGEIGGFLKAMGEESQPVELIPIIRAWAMSGGSISAETLTFFEAELSSGLTKNLPDDGVYLSVHGAAASENVDDFEGYLVMVVKNIVGASVPFENRTPFVTTKSPPPSVRAGDCPTISTTPEAPSMTSM